MISPENYKLLSVVANLPGRYYPEDQQPALISPDRQQYLVELQLLEIRTLVSAESHEPLYPNGCVGYYLTPFAEDEMASFEEQNRQIHAEAEAKKKEAKSPYKAITQIVIPIAAIVIPAIIALFFQ